MAFAFAVLVFVGLGLSGTFNAALAGYHTITSNPIIQQMQNKAANTIKGEASSQIHKLESTINDDIVSKIT